jgi:hypothetical protein
MKKIYSWSVNATYEVKDIEIHRSIAGGDYEDNQLKNPFITPQNIGQESNELPIWNSFFN